MNRRKKLIASSGQRNDRNFTTPVQNIVLSLYNEYPVLCWNHDYNILPIGLAEDLHIDENGMLSFFPKFNESTELGLSCKKMFDDGFLRACSIGGLVKLNNAGDIAEKFLLREISIVVIPSDAGAVSNEKLSSYLSENSITQLSSSENKKPNYEKECFEYLERNGENSDGYFYCRLNCSMDDEEYIANENKSIEKEKKVDEKTSILTDIKNKIYDVLENITKKNQENQTTITLKTENEMEDTNKDTENISAKNGLDEGFQTLQAKDEGYYKDDIDKGKEPDEDLGADTEDAEMTGSEYCSKMGFQLKKEKHEKITMSQSEWDKIYQEKVDTKEHKLNLDTKQSKWHNDKKQMDEIKNIGLKGTSGNEKPFDAEDYAKNVKLANSQYENRYDKYTDYYTLKAGEGSHFYQKIKDNGLEYSEMVLNAISKTKTRRGFVEYNSGEEFLKSVKLNMQVNGRYYKLSPAEYLKHNVELHADLIKLRISNGMMTGLSTQTDYVQSVGFVTDIINYLARWYEQLFPNGDLIGQVPTYIAEMDKMHSGNAFVWQVFRATGMEFNYSLYQSNFTSPINPVDQHQFAPEAVTLPVYQIQSPFVLTKSFNDKIQASNLYSASWDLSVKKMTQLEQDIDFYQFASYIYAQVNSGLPVVYTPTGTPVAIGSLMPALANTVNANASTITSSDVTKIENLFGAQNVPIEDGKLFVGWDNFQQDAYSQSTFALSNANVLARYVSGNAPENLKVGKTRFTQRSYYGRFDTNTNTVVTPDAATTPTMVQYCLYLHTDFAVKAISQPEIFVQIRPDLFAEGFTMQMLTGMRPAYNTCEGTMMLIPTIS